MKKPQKNHKELGSFRDPSGFVYYRNKKIFRQIHQSYLSTFTELKNSGFLTKLTKQKLLLPFKETSLKLAFDTQAVKVLQTPRLPFVSYPYEWSFSQLKDAALLTLKLQKIALQHGFSLKDASAYNIQFWQGKPILIDLLSFEKYMPGKPWVAYRQFCEQFLGPLLLINYTDLRLTTLLRTHLDGIPLDLISRLLPKKTFLRLAISMHIHFHAKNQQQFGAQHQQRLTRLSKLNLIALLDNLESLINSLSLANQPTEWGKYYTFTNYSGKAFANKKKIVKQFINQIKPKTVWDLGGNTGEFSRLASNKGIFTVSFDIDPKAVEHNYQQVKTRQEKQLLPLLLDLTNPSPRLGWALTERQSLLDRGPVELVMALALIHHLAISQNLPFENIADLMQNLSKYLIIEFVPKTDSQVQKLLSTRKDIFDHYDQHNFEKAFLQHFHIIKKEPIKHGSQRVLYLMKKK